MKYILISIIILAAVLRVYKLDTAPPSISWDEAAVGYNAFSIANYGFDEWGKNFPLYFTSFRDDKNPVHIYATALFVKFLGLSEFSVRLPMAVFGVLNVLLLYFLGNTIFKNQKIGLIAAFFLAISPYNLQFSRFNHELNFAVFFFMLGLLLFLIGIEKNKKLIPLAFLSFGLDLFTYQSSKVVVPPIVILLIIIYFKKLVKIKKMFIAGVLILSIFIFTIFSNPALLGTARINQSPIPSNLITNSYLYHLTKNEFFGRIEAIFTQYITHFTPKYLFISGDSNGRHSTQTIGEFYKIDAVFLITGFLGLFWQKNKKPFILLAWALLAPLPASAVFGAPHAARAMFTTGSWHIIAALGAYNIIFFFKKINFRILISTVFVIAIMVQLAYYLPYYYQEYPKKQATEWQYGMKQIVEFVKLHPEYQQIYMTDIRFQPYIFFLFYLKTPLPDFLNSVVYNNSKESKDYNLVSYFDKYYFGGWDVIESMPNPGVLYALTNNQYGGLRHKLEFDVKKVIYYPDGSEDYYLISTK